MFEPEFADKKKWAPQLSRVGAWQSSLPRSTVEKTQALYWREHCLECAPPECYHSCPLYVARQDRRCARLEYGIYPNRSLNGLLEYGAEVRFRKWGKLGTILYAGALSPSTHNFLSWWDRMGAVVVSLAYQLLRPVNPTDLFQIKSRNPQRLGYKAYAYLRDTALSSLSVLGRDSVAYEAFILECFSFESEPFNLLLEYKDSIIRSRHAIEIKPGHNYREIRMGEFNGRLNPLRGILNLYPENDREAHVAFTWLDFCAKEE